MAHILWFWVTCVVKMVSLCHGWGWQPLQTACHIHFRHKQSVWTHWYAVHRHMAVAPNSYTQCTWVRFCDPGSLVESTWYHYVMAEADSQLKLLLASILNIKKCLSTLIYCFQAYSSSLKQLYPPYLGHIWVCHLCSQNDVITSWLRLTVTSNCCLRPHHTYTQYLSTLICCPWAYGSSL